MITNTVLSNKPDRRKWKRCYVFVYVVCMHFCKHVLMGVALCVYTYIERPDIDIGCLLVLSLPYILRQGLSVAPTTHQFVTYPRDPLSPPPSYWNYRQPLYFPTFTWVPDVNSGPHDYTSSTLLTKPSPQPPASFRCFYKHDHLALCELQPPPLSY